MTSQINTNGIDTNYPVPGQNNNSQGFRDNFAQIRTNLNTASAEITDLQSKVVLKAALDNSVLNNDMANTLISNASIRSFRHTTYNLGNALTGTILVDASRADYQYGAVQANTTFQFGGWAPTNTEQTITMRLNVSNANAIISLPNASVSTNNDYGTTLFENFKLIGNTATFTAPANVSTIEFDLTTTDCGNTISILPTNRSFRSTQVIERNVSPTGLMGDSVGTVAVGPQVGQVNVTQTANVPTVITANVAVMNNSTISGTTLTIGTLASGTVQPGMLLSGGSVLANTYIVSGSGSTWVVSQAQTLSSTNLTGSTGVIGTTLVVGVQTSGVVQSGMIITGSGIAANTWIVENLSGSGSGSTWRVSSSQYATPSTINGNIDVMTCTSTVGFYRDMPITFTGTVFGGVISGTTYYVKEVVDSDRFTLSAVPGGSMLSLSSATGNMQATPTGYLYVAVDSYNSISYNRQVSNTYQTSNFIKLNTTNNLEVNAPIIFTGSTFGGLKANTVYFVKSIDAGNANITVSQSRFNGIAGSEVLLDTDSGNCTATCYIGENIWRQVPLLASDYVPGAVNIPTTANIRIGGGINGYVLTTDGTGNLTWSAGAGSGNGSVAGSNTQIQFNNNGNFGAVSGFTFNSSTNVFSTPGNVAAVGTIQGSNLAITNTANVANLVVTGNANVVNLTAALTLNANGNITGGNLYTNGNLSVTGDAFVGNLGTVGSIVATGIVAAGILNGTSLVISANANISNLIVNSTANVVGNVFSNSNVISNTYFVSSVATSIVSTGTTQADATVLAKQLNVVSTVTSGTGVRLPTAVSGMRVVIRNAGANSLNVYPDIGGRINTLSINASYSLAANTSIEFFCTASSGTSQWYIL